MATADPKIQWQRRRFKKNKVWLACDATGKPIGRDGKVLIKYQLDQDYEYWVNPARVTALDSGSSAGRPPAKGRSRKKPRRRQQAGPDAAAPDAAPCRNAICIYTDGASSGNPGPAGLGVVLRYGGQRKEISKYIGTATNNVAELMAIAEGLQALKSTDIPVRIFTDSSYAYGVLALGWKARKNQNLVKRIKTALAKFSDCRLIKIKGHAGHAGNERADFLATSAIRMAAPNN